MIVNVNSLGFEFDVEELRMLAGVATDVLTNWEQPVETETFLRQLLDMIPVELHPHRGD